MPRRAGVVEPARGGGARSADGVVGAAYAASADDCKSSPVTLFRRGSWCVPPSTSVPNNCGYTHPEPPPLRIMQLCSGPIESN